MKKKYQSRNATKVPETFAAMLAVAAKFLANKGVSDVDDAALDLMFQFTDLFNGETIYLPKAADLKAERRNRELFKDSRRGMSYDALAKKHELTVGYVYEVVAEMRRRYLNEVQIDMFRQPAEPPATPDQPAV